MCMRMGVAALLCCFVAFPAFALTSDEAPCANVPSAERSSCLVTRDYLTKARRVVSGEMDPTKFPGKPDGLEEKFLSAQEIALINKAVDISLMKMLDLMDEQK